MNFKPLPTSYLRCQSNIKRLLNVLSDEISVCPVAETGEFVQQCEEIGFVDAESLDRTRKLYFNGNIFRRDNTRSYLHFSEYRRYKPLQNP